MTVPSENYAPLRYRCNGSATQFAVTWPFFNASDIKVVYIGNSSTTEFSRVLNGNYSVTGGSGGTGAITTLGTDPSGNDPYDDGTLIITRVTPITQTIDYRSTKAFSPAISERALDKLTRAIQERESSIDFCLKLPGTTNLSVIDTVLETPTAGGTLVWNAEANKIISGSTVDAPVSAWAKTLIDDVSASAAMGTLGFSDFFKALVGITTLPDDRPKFTWVSQTVIYISPGSYRHAGTKDQYVSWNSELTFNFGPGGSNAGSDALGANSKVYLYLDDSAIVTHASATMVASCFVNKSGTFPTWNHSKNGWYDGNDRCILGLATNPGAGWIEEFVHDGGDFFSCYRRNAYADAAPGNSTSKDTVTLPVVPKFATKAYIRTKTTYQSGTDYSYCEPYNATSGTQRITLGYVAAGGTTGLTNSIVFTGSSQRIKIWTNAGDAKMQIDVMGWFFPKGM